MELYSDGSQMSELKKNKLNELSNYKDKLMRQIHYDKSQ